jgi:hypothetical protein
LLLNNKGSKFITRRKWTLWMKMLNRQEVPTWMQECHISRVQLAIRSVTSTTQGWTWNIKNSWSLPKPICKMRRSKTSRLQTMLLMLILMLFMFLICHTMILMLLMFLWETSLEKSLPCTLDHTTKGQRLVCGCPSVLLLTWNDPIKLGYLKTKTNLFCKLTSLVEQVGC